MSSKPRPGYVDREIVSAAARSPYGKGRRVPALGVAFILVAIEILVVLAIVVL